MEIGNIENDLAALVELLSTDAVQVVPGDRVLIENWGSSGALNGVVERVDPFGFTKVSALSEEEQRANTIIGFTDPKQQQRGHSLPCLEVAATALSEWQGDVDRSVPALETS